MTLGRLQDSMNPVQKLRRGDRRNHDRLVSMVTKDVLEVELAALCGYEDARIDYDSHGVSGKVGWFWAISATASR